VTELLAKIAEPLLHPARLYSASDILSKPCPVPPLPGVYAFYFNEPPARYRHTRVSPGRAACAAVCGHRAKAPSAERKPEQISPPKAAAKKPLPGQRIGLDFATDAGLSAERATRDQAAPGGQRGPLHLHKPGEQVLDAWMRQHAFVTWVETNAPWELEDYLLTSAGLRLPLNLDGNPCPEAVSTLAAIRLKARQQADRFDIVIDSGGPRKLPSPRA